MVRAAWLRWPTSLDSRLRLAGSFVSGYSSVCFEIKLSGRHRGFDVTGTVRQAWWCRTTLHLFHPWGCALGQPVKQASALVREEGTCHIVKERKKKRKQPLYPWRWYDNESLMTSCSLLLVPLGLIIHSEVV